MKDILLQMYSMRNYVVRWLIKYVWCIVCKSSCHIAIGLGVCAQPAYALIISWMVRTAGRAAGRGGGGGKSLC